VVFQIQDSTNQAQAGANNADYLVSAADIRTLVVELWLAGAEAVAVNGERITASTAILDIGGSVLVNSAYLAPPYQVAAIGPADLYEQLSQAVGFRELVQARAETFGIRLSYAILPDVVIPAYAGTINLRFARPAPSASPAPTGPSPTAAPTSAPTAAPTSSPSAGSSPAKSARPGATPRPTSRASARPRSSTSPAPANPIGP
jgi:hypothetical protein